MRTWAIRAAALTCMLTMLTVFATSVGGQEQSTDDKNIQVTTFRDLAYPSLARVAGLQGTVVVRVSLDDEGKVVEAATISGSPLLAIDSIANVKTWTFRPNATNSAIIIYNFVILPGICSDRAGSLFVLQGRNVATILTCRAPVNVTATQESH